MSSTSQGPGWWQASDGNWYAPEQHPDYRPPAAPQAPPVAPPSAPPTGPTVPEYAPGPAVPQYAPSAATKARSTPAPAEIAVLAGGAVALVCSFLPFYSAPFGSESLNAWDTGVFPTATLIMLFAVIGAGLCAVSLFNVTLPKRILTFTPHQIVVAGGVFATVLALSFLVQDHGSADLGAGYWLMLAGSIAVLVGGVVLLRADTTTES